MRASVTAHAHALRVATLCFGVLAIAVRLDAQTVTITSAPSPLVISTATPGSDPIVAISNTSRMTIVVTTADSRLSAYLESPLPPNVTLSVEVQTVSGAFSSGPVVLDAMPREVLTGIPAGNYSGLLVTYTLSARAAAGTISLATSTVVFTLGNGP
jgi:hypothetical protein